MLIFLMMILDEGWGQDSRKIIDNESGLPVPFVTIKVLNKPKGTIASETGNFILKIDDADSVWFSSIGYESIVIRGSKIGTVVKLIPKVKLLPDVRIGNRKFVRTLVLGDRTKKIEEDFNWGPTSGIKEEFAQFIELPDTNRLYHLKKVFLPVKKIKGCWGAIFLRIYAPDSTGRIPGEELLFEHLTIMKIKNKRAVVDLADKNIYISKFNGFYVSLGWPEEAEREKCLTTFLFSAHSNKITLARNLLYNDYTWYLFGDFTDTKQNKTSRRLAISAEVDEFY